jgi:transposase
MKVYYIGMDVHKKNISFCIKTESGKIIEEDRIAANRAALLLWVSNLPQPWIGAMEATLFTGWIYDFLKPHALKLKVAHPQMLKAIIVSKKKNDKVDARTIADLLRCDLLPVCYMAPEKIRELRRVLRYRNLMVREAVRMKNKMSGLLMEVGGIYSKKRLHGKKYFSHLLESIEEVPDSVKDLLLLSRANYEMFNGIQKRLIEALHHEPLISGRIQRLMTIEGVGEVTALSWVLEVGDSLRFGSIKQAISYCGLCSAQKESAGRNHRGPISKQRNKHLQTVLIEAAKLAPRWNAQMAEVYEHERQKGHHNRATLAVARKLVSYMLAVDRRGTNFIPAAKAKVA